MSLSIYEIYWVNLCWLASSSFKVKKCWIVNFKFCGTITDLLWLTFSFAVAADGNEPVQIKLHKSLRLWTFYVDLEESLGTLESTRVVYERILDLRIATPQIIINYALLLEVWTFLLLFNYYVPFTFIGFCRLTTSYCFHLCRSINTLKMHSKCMKEVSRFLSTLM